MCTSIAYSTDDFYFGRNLDVDQNYRHSITIVPRNYPLSFSCEESQTSHFAMIGMATIINDYPLYADACNEKGLCVSGLNFTDNAVYFDKKATGFNVSPYEFILWILSNNDTVDSVLEKLNSLTLVNIPFNDKMPLTPLHFMISDKTQSITVESVSSGLKVYKNPVNVLTNSPTFDYHLQNLCNYQNLSPSNTSNTFLLNVELANYGVGIGAIGLPGDFSSVSRFIKASYVLNNSKYKSDDLSSIVQFFHILDSVKMVSGAVEVSNNNYDITLYSSCINATKGVYYYKTYSNPTINSIDMNKENLDSKQIISYEWQDISSFNCQNA